MHVGTTDKMGCMVRPNSSFKPTPLSGAVQFRRYASEATWVSYGPALLQQRGSFMTTNTKVKGPASYFPSIEKTYGKPVAHWFKLLDSISDKKHMEQVAILKSEHKMGHGHANALVAYHRAQHGG